MGESVASPEFSRVFAVDRLGQDVAREEIVATAAERAALARRLGLVALPHLAAKTALQRTRGRSSLRLDAHVTAEVVQTCVVTLEPVASRIDEQFTVFYASEGADPRHLSLTIDDPEAMESEDDAELLVGNVIDLGEAVAQHLALALDPYPRAEGVALSDVWQGESEADSRPFAVLARLKNGGD